MDKNFYFFYGNSDFELQQATKAVLKKNKNLNQQIIRFNRQDYKTNLHEVISATNEIYDQLLSKNLFDENYTLILQDGEDLIVKNSPVKDGIKLQQSLEALTKLKNKNFLLVLLANKISNLKVLDAKWKSTLEEFQAKNLSPPYFEDQISWTIKEAEENFQLKINNKLAAFIINKSNANKNLIVNELYKIKLLQKANLSLNFDNISRLISGGGDDFLIFKLIDLIAYKKKTQISTLINQLYLAKSISAANTILIRNLERLYILKNFKTSGQGLSVAEKLIPAPPWLIKKQWALVDLFSKKDLEKILIDACDNDLKIKMLGDAGKEIMTISCKIAADRASKGRLYKDSWIF